ncbi:DUF3240 family protein [Zeimonas arvi]|uniref:DUF3240 domain-containing protein n=1 Tax=Zeimonas arvi TaxID=2498847 RepID=A0A5C8P0W8_9BURK|nr:DUF3240 family protein [Zeimonas arvi]TXL66958.1 DUF3240 domain-containing protein [Zeimonas arvi]
MTQGRTDIVLTLVAPAALEEPLVDLLLAMPELAGGFTSSPADGHGTRVPLVGADENVRGRGKRVRIEIALASAALSTLLDAIRQAMPAAPIHFWTMPILDFGSLQ